MSDKQLPDVVYLSNADYIELCEEYADIAKNPAVNGQTRFHKMFINVDRIIEIIEDDETIIVQKILEIRGLVNQKINGSTT